MYQKIKNWHFSVLVGVVSIISIFLIEQYATAQWNDPIGLPGETNGFRLVVNPMKEDLLLNGYDLLDSNLRIDANGQNAIQVANGSNICFSGTSDCINSWADINNSFWQRNGTKIYYNEGNVGIGTNNPQTYLDVYPQTPPSDSTPFIRSISWENGLYGAVADMDNMNGGPIDFRFGATENYGVFRRGFTIRDETSGANRFFIAATGNVGIGTDYPNKQLHVAAATSNAEIDIQSTTNTHWGLYQDNATADLRFWNTDNRVTFTDSGNVGIGTINPIASLHINKGTGQNYAGYFNGNVTLQHTSGGPYNYLQIDRLSTGLVVPPAADCNEESEKARMIYDSNNNRLYICDDGAWISAVFN